ncbi:MAG: Type 11 methyltransferase [Parcubacteria group bacterium GW2011_GWD2_38_12]|uniref:Methyltransferase domain-containing protein n=1 Tax=Candidatus Azambacteria bacterium RIFCSPLOWO2_01_FULL_37_9 TaxID=1797297 RepID=A0A1F5C6J7_9BACT|nr:MAG: Type 11 methyltransferase [Parcubacteria group bacterium GW2011_GWC2_36_17]KKQ39127.1 MAG: Type 11 methyltransferase [Candidatus Moranbacteria bacterium GW2011_GWF2_37_7]KKQ51461.1 MAG: Type 11 methyltransferase [Parcubacteria group bacterium GW2011_GWD2_38_12]KKQ58714.1 MAG: Type 11 methyltransferase [Parcubacteria group bacterium GW2011_GWC1_38_17]KKQ59307.1 MAG: Type 11 methyltransferase [Parcubacteria group bacterium GW2011_GWD1_38_16]OGD38472.1 MAG: hypothetical protein A2907_0279
MLIRGFLSPEDVLRQIDLREGTMIGDFGAGSGHFAIAMAKIVGNYGKIFAIDVREASLESVRSRARMANLANINYIRANLEIAGATEIADGILDLVILITVLSQSNKKEEILKEALRVLKRGGKLLVVEWSQTGPAFASSHEYRITKEDMQKIIEGVGFKLDKELDVKSFHYGFLFVKS